MSHRTLALWLACALPACGALAQAVEALPQAVEALALPAEPPPPIADALPRTTWDFQTARSTLSAGLPDGEAQNLRGAITMAPGHVLQLDFLKERKFGEQGGVVAAAYTAVLTDRWYLTHTVAGGHGGPNWANLRTDLQVSRKWLSQGQLVTSLAAYKAWFDNDRSDAGARLSMVWYLPGMVVLEQGIVLNVSQPGSVNSHMPYAAITVGREGWQYFSVRASSGTEAYQAIGEQAQLVDFRSSSLAFGWRRWVGRTWGFTFQDEHYRNPSYRRRTLGIGVFAQF